MANLHYQQVAWSNCQRLSLNCSGVTDGWLRSADGRVRMSDSTSSQGSQPVSEGVSWRLPVCRVAAPMVLLLLAACAPAPQPPAPPPPPPPWNGGANPAGGPVYHGGTLVAGRTAPSHTPGTVCYTVSGWCTLERAKPIPAECDCRPASGPPNPTGSVN